MRSDDTTCGRAGSAQASRRDARTVAASAIAALSFATLSMTATSEARGAASCPVPPPAPIRDLALDRYYGDKTGSEIDPARKAAHAAATRPLVDYLRTVTDAADHAVTRRDAAPCAAAWLDAWARADALLGQMSGPQAQSQRKWDLAGLALAVGATALSVLAIYRRMATL